VSLIQTNHSAPIDASPCDTSCPAFDLPARQIRVSIDVILQCPVLCLRCVFTSDEGGGICFRPRSFVCLSVSKITKNACMDLDEVLRVD